MDKKKLKIAIIAAGAVLLVVAILVGIILLTKPAVKIGFLGVDLTDSEMLQFRNRLKKDGYEIYDAYNLESLVQAQCAAWIVRSIDDDKDVQILLEAQDKPVIFVERRPTLSEPTTYVGADVEKSAQLLANIVEELPNGGDGNEDGVTACLLLCGPKNDANSALWTQSVTKELENSQQPVEIMNTTFSPLTADAGKETCAQELAQYGRDVEVVLAYSDQLIYGAYQAIEGGGWKQGRDGFLIGNGSSEDIISALQEEKVSGIVWENRDQLDEMLYTALKDSLSGKAQQHFLLEYKKYIAAYTNS